MSMRNALYAVIGFFASIGALAQPFDRQALEAAWSKINAHGPVPPKLSDLEEYLHLATRHVGMLQQQLNSLMPICRHAGPQPICQQINTVRAKIRAERARKADAEKSLHYYYPGKMP
jgi:hypothetical protein